MPASQASDDDGSAPAPPDAGAPSGAESASDDDGSAPDDVGLAPDDPGLDTDDDGPAPGPAPDDPGPAPHDPGPAPDDVGLALVVGERYPVGDRLFTLTPRLAEATLRSRRVLVEAAAHRDVVTYGELSEEIGGLVLPRHMGPLLHMLGHDCAARGEPGLPALVINRTTGEVGTSDGAWAPPERRACWAFWSSDR